AANSKATHNAVAPYDIKGSAVTSTARPTFEHEVRVPDSTTLIDLHFVTKIRANLENQQQREHDKLAADLTACLGHSRHPHSGTSLSGQIHLDTGRIQAISTVILRNNLTQLQAVQLVRGESKLDPRLNKALQLSALARLYKDYEHRDTLLEIATHGCLVSTSKQLPRAVVLPPNHKSAEMYADTVTQHLRDDQDCNEYLFLSQDVHTRWMEAGHIIHFSPLGLVPKKGKDLSTDGRVIHDLSYPKQASLNDVSNRVEYPTTQRKKITDIARRITSLRNKYMEWLETSKAHSDLYGFERQMQYVYGRGISYLIGRESPVSLSPSMSNDNDPFWAWEWMDDHVSIEAYTSGSLDAAACALRLAMMATLGPRAINDDKFKPWSTQLYAVDLDWDLERGLVSMPVDKLAKARERVDALLSRQRTTRSLLLLHVLCSLRHVTSCVPAARPFYQRLHSTAIGAPPFRATVLNEGARSDLQWFKVILEQMSFTNIPTEIFGRTSIPDVHLYMDACDNGLVVLDPSNRRFVRLFFDQSERAEIAEVAAVGAHNVSRKVIYSINVRQYLSLCFVIATWGTEWQGLHIQAWLDNTSGVPWTNSLTSSNSYAQELNRHMGVMQAVNRIHVSASHLAGALNTMADAGSRSCSEPYNSQWSILARGWTETPIPKHLRFADYQAQSVAGSTAKRYGTYWRLWQIWRTNTRTQTFLPVDSDATSEQLVSFCLYLRDKGATAAAIRVKDATLVSVRIPGSKTDQRGAGTTLCLDRSNSPWLCPGGAGNSDPLCTWTTAQGPKTITDRDVTTALRRAATKMGKDPTWFLSHSLRSGGATVLFRAGGSKLAIQKLGRWRSDSFKAYARIDDIEVAQLAQLLTIGAPPHHTQW
ncbi:hypothetical protein ACHHYP_17238, partial [Achlya hypogyna]